MQILLSKTAKKEGFAKYNCIVDTFEYSVDIKYSLNVWIVR